ncbi:MAG: hypothetical protein A2104_06330 [Candidatus Melainabacteria bacterium GWF2_32_7]|nr:MAG: hypothetical protein A2104_06330 [Candidatus Melainabacteria bacterium GWF2_32_7]
MNIEDLRIKASKIKLIAFDVDGVLTDGSITYTDKGEEIKTFDAKDGHGMASLRVNGFITAIITARSTPIVEKRAKDLDVVHVYQGAKRKIVALEELINIYKLDFSEIAYVGDDMPDVCILEKVGLACCPADAVDEVKNLCHFISTKPGGKGAVREVSDFIIANRKAMVPK